MNAVNAPAGGRAGRRRSTTRDHIADIALDLFATYGFNEISVDDVALASGIARRTLFRYYLSKNAIPRGLRLPSAAFRCGSGQQRSGTPGPQCAAHRKFAGLQFRR